MKCMESTTICIFDFVDSTHFIFTLFHDMAHGLTHIHTDFVIVMIFEVQHFQTVFRLKSEQLAVYLSYLIKLKLKQFNMNCSLLSRYYHRNHLLHQCLHMILMKIHQKSLHFANTVQWLHRKFNNSTKLRCFFDWNAILHNNATSNPGLTDWLTAWLGNKQ